MLNTAQFTGTEHYYAHSLGFGRSPFVYTDGVKYVADTAKAYWLLDAIISHAMKFRKTESFMVARLVVDGNSAVFTLTDGDKGDGEVVLARQEIEYTDFPAEGVEFFIEPADDKFSVIMLPSER